MRRRFPLLLPLTLLPALMIVAGASLPEAGPVPTEKPGTVEAAPAPTLKDGVPGPAAEMPKPEEKPAPPTSDKDTPPTSQAAPAAPEAKPEAGTPVKPENPGTPQAELVIAPEEPKAYAQCITDLKAMGATFEEKPRIDDGKGCGIDKPISVTAVLPGVTLKPEATLRCEAALELARWTREAVLPAAKVAMSEDGTLMTINQASSYICRLRNNASTGKISEHARGNAIDIASFTFKNGETIAIQPRDEDGTLPGAFQRAVTATGCLYFETVLDPGSDEAHENHLHFDVLQRRGNYRYCR